MMELFLSNILSPINASLARKYEIAPAHLECLIVRMLVINFHKKSPVFGGLYQVSVLAFYCADFCC
ncbi:hypothetical protein, partial [Plesiomonas shigelloides]|uniref:hypothetical protein n=1 Tax=Plesiomonas shigelloides TaxID=703 RepID=UPI001C498E66